MEETRLTLRLPDALKTKLEFFGDTEERSLNWQIVQAVKEYVKRKEDEMASKFSKTLNAFIASDDFKDGVISATKASWGGGGYSVELFPDSTWRVLWDNQIGNKYETPGIILGLPTISEESTANVDETAESETDATLRDAFDIERDELANELVGRL